MKLFKKIALSTVGAVMAIGVGIGAVFGNGLMKANALDETYTYVTGNGSGDGNVWTYDTGNFLMVHRKNGSSNNIASTYAELRVYASHSMEITPKVAGSMYITAVVVTASSSSYATAMSNATVVAGVDSAGASSHSGGSAAASVTTFDFSDVTNCGFVKFTLAAQSRTVSWKITYIDASAPVVPVEGISLNHDSVSVKATKTVTLTATVTPADATNSLVDWSSDDEAVATVVGGVVTGVAEGTATITATTRDGGFTADCEVTVLPEPVVEHAGTLADPYSVSDAILVAEDTGTTATTSSYYIRGFISLVKSVDTGTYGNAEFEIKDSLLDGEKFLVYRAFADDDGAAFTVESAKEIRVGYLATVYGKIVNYNNNTPETTQGTKNVSMTTHVHSIDKTQATADAASFAASFNDTMGDVCDLDGLTDTTNLTAAWNARKANFNALVEGAQYILKNAVADVEGSAIEQFVAKYTYIGSKYELDNFLDLDALNSSNKIVNDGLSFNNSIFVVIVLFGSLVTAVALRYYFLKKKEN